jgi:hypothetical protein
MPDELSDGNIVSRARLMPNASHEVAQKCADIRREAATAQRVRLRHIRITTKRAYELA